MMSKEDDKRCGAAASFEIGDKVRKVDSDEVGTVIEVDYSGDKVKVSPDNENLHWNRQLASNFVLVSKAKSNNKINNDGKGDGGVSLRIGDKVRKISSGNGFGELGTVAEIDHEKGLIKVSPDSESLKWNRQNATNFELVSKADVRLGGGGGIAKKVQPEPPAEAKKNDSPQRTGGGGGIHGVSVHDASSKACQPERVDFEVGDKVKKVRGKDAGEIGTVLELERGEDTTMTIKVSPENELSKWNRQNASNFALFEKAKKVAKKKVAEVKKAEEKRDEMKGGADSKRSDAPVGDAVPSLNIGDKVKKSKGKDSGETGTVLQIDHNVGDGVDVKVSPDNEDLKPWPKQSASNFEYVSGPKKVVNKITVSAAISAAIISKSNAVSATAGGKDEQPCDRKVLVLEVGDVVKKISGANKDETGIVVELYHEGDKELVKVEPNCDDIRWPKQCVTNFELVSHAVKISTKSQTTARKNIAAAATSVAVAKEEEEPQAKAGHSDATFEIGDKVRKISGANKDETGIVAEVYFEGEKELVKVEPDNHDLKSWPKQSASNFELLGESDKEPEILSPSKEFNYTDCPAYPAEFTGKTLTEMPQMVGDSFIYRGERYSASEWAKKLKDWERIYPNIVKGGKRSSKSKEKECSGASSISSAIAAGGAADKGEDDGKDEEKAQSVAPFETVKYRTKQTTNESIIEDCWNDEKYVNRFHNAFKGIPISFLSKNSENFRDVFRVDMYGNVVSIEASDGALCKFDVDHIFPWSRGGKSAKANFAGVHWSANRNVKSDSMIMSLSPDSMRVGLMPEQFKALYDYAVSPERGERRNVKFCVDTIFRYWLLSGPVKGSAIADFRKEVGGSTDGAVLWNFFERHFDEQQERAVVRVQLSHKIYLRSVGSLVECFGDMETCIPAFEGLGFTYNSDTLNVSKRVKKVADRDLLIKSIEDFCKKQNFILVQIVY